MYRFHIAYIVFEAKNLIVLCKYCNLNILVLFYLKICAIPKMLPELLIHFYNNLIPYFQNLISLMTIYCIFYSRVTLFLFMVLSKPFHFTM